MNRRRSNAWIWIVLSALTLFIVGGVGLTLVGGVMSGGATTLGPRVGLVEVSGAIMDEGAGSLVGGSSPGARDVIEDLEKARRDPDVKAVVIRINSPGGSAAASQEIYQAVRRLGKPVVCSMGDVAASGGYYVAAACDKIYANGSTLTGSIGVISQFLNYEQLFKKLGLDEATIKSGRFKDAGNPARPLTLAERQLFQAMIGDVYGQFITDVLKGRKNKLTRAQLLKLADGRVYTGQQAVRNKLIDSLGGLHDAVQDAAQRGGISGEPRIKNFSQGRGLFGSLFGAGTDEAVSREVQKAAAALGASAGHAFATSVKRELTTQTSPTLQTRSK